MIARHGYGRFEVWNEVVVKKWLISLTPLKLVPPRCGKVLSCLTSVVPITGHRRVGELARSSICMREGRFEDGVPFVWWRGKQSVEVERWS